jgi:hypothetical protein
MLSKTRRNKCHNNRLPTENQAEKVLNAVWEYFIFALDVLFPRFVFAVTKHEHK